MGRRIYNDNNYFFRYFAEIDVKLVNLFGREGGIYILNFKKY